MDNLELNTDNVHDLGWGFVSKYLSIYEYKDGMIVKIFNTNNLMNLRIMKDRLDYFLENHPDYAINPLALVFYDVEYGQFRGYILNGLDGEGFLDYIKYFNVDDKIDKFKLLSNTLKYAHKDGIVIGNLVSSNIITNANGSKFYGVEFFGIGKMPPLLISRYLDMNPNIDIRYKGTKESDVFLLHKMVFDTFLSKEFNYDIFRVNTDLYKKSINGLYLPEDVSEVFSDLYNMVNGNGEIIYPDEYLDSLKSYARSRRIS